MAWNASSASLGSAISDRQARRTIGPCRDTKAAKAASPSSLATAGEPSRATAHRSSRPRSRRRTRSATVRAPLPARPPLIRSPPQPDVVTRLIVLPGQVAYRTTIHASGRASLLPSRVCVRLPKTRTRRYGARSFSTRRPSLTAREIAARKTSSYPGTCRRQGHPAWENPPSAERDTPRRANRASI